MRFFKYVTAETARIVLESATCRWSSPLIFNDPFDVQFDLHLEFDEQKIVDLIVDELWEIYSGKKTLKAANALGQIFESFLKRVPGLSRKDIFERQGLRDSIRESIERTKTLLPQLHAQQRSLLQRSKLLCLSEVHDNILMWSHYTRDHTGAVLEFDSDKDRDSPLNRAERVNYSRAMPRLMTEANMVHFFSGQWRMDANVIMHNSIFTKAADWSYEKEWRVWLPGTDATQRFLDLAYQREELVGIYFGCRISDDNQTMLRNVVTRYFSHASVYRANKSEREFTLQFEPIN
jgi:hypothetical protein